MMYNKYVNHKYVMLSRSPKLFSSLFMFTTPIFLRIVWLTFSGEALSTINKILV